MPNRRVPTETVTAGFFVSLAALDVEENERAARVLDELVKTEPSEPALWANLAVAKLRLNDLQAAELALNEALQRAPESREVLRLKAQFLESSGDIGSAINVLRKLNQQWPQNIRVAFNLSLLLGQMNSESADSECLRLLEGILKTHPQNLRVRCESARLAATIPDIDSLQSSIEFLNQDRSKWTDPQLKQLDQAMTAAGEGNFRQAAVSLTFFENLSKPSVAYQRSLDELGILSVTAVGTPVRSFIAMAMPPAEASPADVKLRFAIDQSPGKAARLDLLLGVNQPGKRCSTLLSLSGETMHVQGSAALPFPGYTPNESLACVAWADMNDDFENDLICVGSEGTNLYLADKDGFGRAELNDELFSRPWKSVWCSDVEADGDLDLMLSDHSGSLQCFLNNGAVGFQSDPSFAAFKSVTSLKEIDFDRDGDLDFVSLDKDGQLHLWSNQRGGKFESTAFEGLKRFSSIAITVADLNRDGIFEIIALDQNGGIRSLQFDGQSWKATDVLPKAIRLPTEGDSISNAFLTVEDIDNNGAIDLVISAAWQSVVWLQDDRSSWHSVEVGVQQLTSVVDVDCDGLLDLIGMSDGQPQLAINKSSANYRWHDISPRANTAAGDKRINSFGIGGHVEVRAGNTIQTKVIESSRVHFGLGDHSQVDVARLIWPNGTSQAEFGLERNGQTVASQRLKGSCPWVFTDNGDEFQFVKDFLWRSPLGLKINAQDTAGVTQTEDRIKLPGSVLCERDGRYEIRITAELWETHFFDSVALVAVDHSIDTEVFVDERFAPQQEPTREIFVGSPPTPMQRVRDENGADVAALLAENDEIYVDGFKLGKYQGVADDHWVEFQFPSEASDADELFIVAHGWIYPTDSSLNVAIAQNPGVAPYGLVLERQLPDGSWEIVNDQIGFPAGKHKDVIIPMHGQEIATASTYRLRTNMEIYWDSLRWSVRIRDDDVSETDLPLVKSDLAHRGYSVLEPIDRRRPDTPTYTVDRVEPIWMDLKGFYTRYGDVAELLAQTDDRYVIMNAGDEMRLQFAYKPVKGIDNERKRDFILIGDGWVKDGDFNTSFSTTVGPLPRHHDVDYQGPATGLMKDPVYLKHSDDWRRFHTRYVSSKPFFKSQKDRVVPSSQFQGE
ncbi:FG-GAP-like repeat-containing protein [Stieleria sp. JC731]|nr:FG-GAP-like repeat-containing protein [Stieleria sp. JC731]MCC9599158.1 FG-GAP-like repeat-containing protein [Stieleria sp. JC731]